MIYSQVKYKETPFNNNAKPAYISFESIDFSITEINSDTPDAVQDQFQHLSE